MLEFHLENDIFFIELINPCPFQGLQNRVVYEATLVVGVEICPIITVGGHGFPNYMLGN